MRTRSDLHPYQRQAVDFILERKRVALLLDLGLGKTVSTLTAMADLLDGCMVNRVLVIAPLRVANSVWRQEAANWEHTADLDVAVCTGPVAERRAALARDAEIIVINRENVPWLVQHYGKRWPFDAVVVDESSSFKNPSAKRFKALKRVLPAIDYVVLLTGTPSPNGLLDLWAQVYLLDRGEALGRTMTAYKRTFFESDFMGYTWTPRPGSAETIHERIAPMVLSMSASDYLQVPERIDLTERVTLPATARRFYTELERELLAPLDNGEEIEAATAAVLANKLLQASNGAMYTDAQGQWEELHGAKLDALAELIEGNPSENILVAYNFKSDLARLQARFPQAEVLDKAGEAVERWNAGTVPLLLAHPASASMGLNLQAGGSTIVWFGLTWSLEFYQQFCGRLHRQGQTKPVRIVHIVAEGTIDERVLQVLGGKDKTQAALLDALKPKKVLDGVECRA